MAFSGSRNISLNELEYVLILEGLEHVRIEAKRDTGPLAGFKVTAIESTISHVQTVLDKLRRAQQDGGKS